MGEWLGHWVQILAVFQRVSDEGPGEDGVQDRMVSGLKRSSSPKSIWFVSSEQIDLCEP